MLKLSLITFLFCVTSTQGQGNLLQKFLPYLMFNNNNQQQQSYNGNQPTYNNNPLNYNTDNRQNYNPYSQPPRPQVPFPSQPQQYQNHYPVVGPPATGPVYTQQPRFPATNSYQPIVPKSVNHCAQYVVGRKVCGYVGINENECKNYGCCWDVSRRDLPYCFFHDAMNSPATSPVQRPPPVQTARPAYSPQPQYSQTQPPTQQPIQYAESHRRVCVPNANAAVCASVGCCYDATSQDPSKRCFHRADGMAKCHALPECQLPTGPAEQCGRAGATTWECQAQGCCYHEIYGVPKCYKKQYVTKQAVYVGPSVLPKAGHYNSYQAVAGQPSPTYNNYPAATSPPKPETTTKLDIVKMLKEMDANLQATQKPSLLDLLNKGNEAATQAPNTLPTQPPPNGFYRPQTATRPPVQRPPPTTPAPITRWQCHQGRCGYVVVPEQQCFPSQCGSPVFVPKPKANLDTKKIVGGTSAYRHSHPWTVMIQKVEGTKTFICGATLICNQWLVTAAHCLDRQSSYKNTSDLNPFMYKIFVGRHSGWRVPYGRQVQVFTGNDIERMLQHEQFIPGKHHGVITHDIALIKLRKRVILNNYVQPACLPTETAKVGSVMFAAGWGVHKGKGPLPTTLKQVGVEIQSTNVCQRRVPGYTNPQGVICGGGEQDHDTCTGDSGGPLVGSKISQTQQSFFSRPATPKWYLYGLTSIGSASCNTLQFDRQPALYTDVFYYLNWIKTHTRNCCA